MSRHRVTAFGITCVVAGACAAASGVPSVVAGRVSKPPVAPTTRAAQAARASSKRLATGSTTAPPTAPPFSAEREQHDVATSIYDVGRAQLTGTAALPSTRWWGVVSAPSDGIGPFPLAIVLHGAHAFCDVAGAARAWPCPTGKEVPNHEGLAYLTDALARRGFVAVAPGINNEFAIPPDNGTRTFGAVAAAEVERVLKALATGSPALGVRPSIVDLNHIVLVGHSRGAALASILGRAGGSPGLSRPVTGLVLIEPTADSTDPALLADIATAVIIGSCDGDTGVDGGQFVAASLGVARRSSPVALILLDRAAHNATNDRLQPEDVPPGRPGCSADGRLDPALQRRTLAELTPELARIEIGASAAGDALQVFNRMRADERVSAGIRIVHVDPTMQRTSLLPEIGQPVATTVFSSQWCPAGRYASFGAPGTEPCHRLELEDLVGRPPGLELTWSSPAASLNVSVPGSTPAPGAALVLRVLIDPADTRVGPGPVTLQLSTRNSTGQTRMQDVVLDVTPVATFDTGSYIARRGAVLWSERRLPLSRPITSLTLTVRSPAAGSLLLISLEVVAQPTPSTPVKRPTPLSASSSSTPPSQR